MQDLAHSHARHVHSTGTRTGLSMIAEQKKMTRHNDGQLYCLREQHLTKYFHSST